MAKLKIDASLFKMMFLSLAILNLNTWLGTNFLSVPIYLFAFICLCFLVKDLFTQRNCINSDYSFLLILFVFLFGITTLLNYKYSFLGNVKVFFWLVLMVMVFYTYPKNQSKQASCNQIQLFCKVTVAFTLVLVLISLLTLIINFNYEETFSSGAHTIIGVSDGRLWGVVHDPNYGAVVSTISIICSVLLFQEKAGGFFNRILLSINMGLQYLYIVFAASRTVDVIIIVVAPLVLSGLCFKQFTVRFSFRRDIPKLLLIVLLPVLLVGLQEPLRNGTDSIRLRVNTYQNEKLEDEEKTLFVALNRSEVIAGEATNTRLKIWKSSIELWKSKPIFGTGYKGYMDYAKENFPQNHFANHRNAVHNECIKVLMASGLAGFGCILAFAVLCLRRVVLYFWRHQGTDLEQRFSWHLLCILAAICVGGMFIDLIFYFYLWSTMVFWLCLGLLMHLTAETQSETKLHRIAELLPWRKLKGMYKFER